MKRLVSYIGAGFSGSVSSSVESIPLDSGISNRFAVIDEGMAVLNRDTLRYVDAAGKTGMELQLGYKRPAIASSGSLFLCYDRGACSLCVANSYEQQFSKTMSSPIISASMAENGAFCVVTDENGYRAAVTVFDKKQNAVYLWQTSEYFVSEAALSPSGEKMAAAVYSGDGVSVVSKVIVFGTSKKEPLCEIKETGGAILALRFISENRISVITETATLVYDINNGPVNTVTYPKGTLCAYAFPENRAALLAFVPSDVSRTIKLSSLDTNGREKDKETINGEIQGISSNGRFCALLTTDKAYILNRDLKAVGKPFEAKGAKEIYMRKDGAAYLVYNSRIELSLPD
ncbi:MAG: DUF5711 family protein [Bacillota bacterium]|nr:DUF5711 family protein [Bacillota bacterium]